MAIVKDMVDIDIPIDLYTMVCMNCGFLKNGCCNASCLKDSIS